LASSIWKWNSFQSWMRLTAARSSGSSRKYSMNPVGLPICFSAFRMPLSIRERWRVWTDLGRGREESVHPPEPRYWQKMSSLSSPNPRHVFGVFLERGHHCFFAGETRFLRLLDRLEHSFVVIRHHLHKLR